MLQALQRWLRPLLSREPMQLIVEGTITETGTHQPRTHLGPKQAPEEAYFTLALSQAQRSDGSTVPVAQVTPPEFSGPVALLEQFSVGDRVRITTTTVTGRQVDAMERLAG